MQAARRVNRIALVLRRLAAAALAFSTAGACADSLSGAARAERDRLVREAELALVRQDTERARGRYDQAAALDHAADIELGLARTYMQMGAYRRALGYASHAAKAHRERPEGAALQAWLLHIGGQRVMARRALDGAIPQDHPAIRAVRDVVQGGGAMPASLPLPTGPYPGPAAVPEAALVVATGLLLDGGARAALPAAALEGRAPGAALWVRNGLGQTTRATTQPSAPGAALILLKLEQPLPSAAWTAVARDAHAGSAAYAVGQPLGDGTPRWPWLQPGFLLRMPGNAPDAAPAMTVTPAPGMATGGLVYDAGGRLVGLALAERDAAGAMRHRLLPVSALRRELGALVAVPETPSSADPGAVLRLRSTEDIYEDALRSSLQVIAAD